MVKENLSQAQSASRKLTSKITFLVSCFLIVLTFSPIVAAEQTVRVGVMASLSGAGASRGDSALLGIALAKTKIKKTASVIELIYEDVPLNDIKKAPAAFKKLVDVDKVSLIIGPMGSSVALATAPLAAAREVPIIAHTASTLSLNNAGPFAFRLWTTAEDYAKVLEPVLKQRSLDKIAMLTATYDNCQDLQQVIVRRLGNNTEYTFVFDQDVPNDSLDFRTVLLQVKSKNPNAIFLNLFEGQIGVAAKQAKNLGYTLPIVSNSFVSQIEVKSAEGALEGVIFPRVTGYTDEVKASFKKILGREPEAPETALAAHDAYLVATAAIEAVGSDRKKIRDYIATNTFNVLAGSIRFESTGTAAMPVEMFTVRDSKIVPLGN